MKNADLQDRVDRAATTLDMRWVQAARRIGAPMPHWLAPASSVGLAGASTLLATFLPKPLRRLALSSALPMVLGRLFR
jgi:hypothetical protein